MVDIPRCKYLKIYFCLGEIEMKVQFCTACKDYWNGHKKWIFFLFPNWPKYLQAQTQFVSSILYMEERKKNTRQNWSFIFFSFSQIAPNLKWKKGMAGLENLSMRMWWWWWCHFLEIYVWHIINSLFLLLLLIYTLW